MDGQRTTDNGRMMDRVIPEGACFLLPKIENLDEAEIYMNLLYLWCGIYHMLEL